MASNYGPNLLRPVTVNSAQKQSHKYTRFSFQNFTLKLLWCTKHTYIYIHTHLDKFHLKFSTLHKNNFHLPLKESNKIDINHCIPAYLTDFQV